MTAPLLETENLVLAIGSRTLVRQLSFRLNPGEVWCMLGPNGAGKSTFLHTVMGLRAAQGGAIRLAGRPLGGWQPVEAAVMRGFLAQSQHDAFSASVLDSVTLGRHPHLARWQWEGEEERAMAHAALEAVDLDGFADRDVQTLSGGERQRAALATLLVQDASLLLLDEPVSHLDLHHQILILEHLRKLARDNEKGVMFTLHDLNLAARFSSHALIIAPDGAVLQGCTADVMTEDNLRRAFGHRVTRIQAAGRTVFIPE